MIKRCGRCKIEKNINNFSKDKNTIDGMQYICRQCIKVRGQNLVNTYDVRKKASHKICSICKIDKLAKDFYIAMGKPCGLESACIECQKKKRSLLEYRVKRNIRKYKNLYGISKKEYEEIMEKQNYSCVICKRNNITFYADHCHNTGKFRGFLCDLCNKGLGHFEDNAVSLINAARYINYAGKIT